MKRIILLFLLTGFWAFGQDFVDITGSLPQLSNAFSAWGDYDGDGDLDLFFTGELNADNNGGGLYKNDNGTFNLVVGSGLPALSLGAADWGDVDNDGDMDLVIMGYNGAGVTDVYINNGNGSFTAASAGIYNSYMGDVVFADYDSDGDLDIALTGIETTGWTFFSKIYKNDGNGNFSDSGLNLPPINYGKFKFADYDNDGDMDFVLHGWNNSIGAAYTKIWQNDGANNFSETSLNLPQLWLGDIEWGDIDNDGHLDLIVTGTSESDSEAHLLINNHDGTFTDDPHFSNVTPVHRVAAIELADFDNNGSLDIFIAGMNVVGETETKIAKIYNNNGSGVFTENTDNSFTGVDYSDADVADYDNDGKIDLFYTGFDSNGFAYSKLYHNGPVVKINNILAEKFDIYPNPAHDILNINSLEKFNYHIQITDLTGESILNQTGEGNLRINISDLPAGLYLVKISDHHHSFVKKLVIK